MNITNKLDINLNYDKNTFKKKIGLLSIMKKKTKD